VLQENSMQVVVQDLEDNTNQVEDMHANNEYVESEDPHSNESEDDDWVNSTRVENITSDSIGLQSYCHYRFEDGRYI